MVDKLFKSCIINTNLIYWVGVFIMKTIKPNNVKDVLSAEKLTQLEQDFIDKYYSSKNKSPFKVLAKLFKGYYLKLVFSAFLYVMKSLPTLYIPIATSDIVDAVVSNSLNATEIIFKSFLISSTLLLIHMPLHYWYTAITSKLFRSVEAGLRGAIVKKLQKLTMKFNKELESGRIQSKIIRDAEYVRDFCNSIFQTGVDTIFIFVCVFTVLLRRGDHLVLMFFAIIIPVAAIIRQIFKSKMSASHKSFRHEMESTTSKVVDVIEMMPITRAHAVEDVEEKQVNTVLTGTAEKAHKLDKTLGTFVSVTWASFNFFKLLCLCFSAVLALKKIISVGAVTLYQSYFAQLFSVVNSIINLLPVISKGGDSIASIGEILSSDDVEHNEEKQKLPSVYGRFEFKDVKFGYETGRLVLKGLNLTVEAGETIAIVGESGAGKSTILNLVTGFYFVNDGEVIIDGNNIKDIDLVAYRKNIAIVPQTNVMFSGSIRDNILYGVENKSETELNEAIKAACLDDVINHMPDGVNTFIGERGAKLSGGQKQRISIARAIIRNPKIIIFDEATSALDTVSECKIQTALNNLTKNRTTFIVAHRLSTIRNADKIAVMKDGVCVEYGTYGELMSKKGDFYNFKILQN